MRYRVNPKGGTLCEGGQHAPGTFIELSPERARSLGDSLELGPDGAVMIYGGEPETAAPPAEEPEAEFEAELETTAIEQPPVDRMIRRGRTVRK